jgi:1-acyl-sn-glycerol-3-phosphate acyltransferase
VQEGMHVWIAPEGTRSKTGALLPFKKGGFNIAMEAGLAILPITISGTKNILPSGAMLSKPGVKVKVTIHPPIEAAPYAQNGLNRKQARDKLMSDVRKSLERGL